MAKKDESMVEPTIQMPVRVSMPLQTCDELLEQALDLTKYTDGDVKRVAMRVYETLRALRGN